MLNYSDWFLEYETRRYASCRGLGLIFGAAATGELRRYILWSPSFSLVIRLRTAAAAA